MQFYRDIYYPNLVLALLYINCYIIEIHNMSTKELNTSTTIGWIGLGQMGVAHVTNLLKHGFSVTCWNRTAEKCAGVCALGAVAVSTPAEVVKASTVTFVTLSNADIDTNNFRAFLVS